MPPRTSSLTRNILLALVAGMLAGLALGPVQDVPLVQQLVIDGALEVIGKIFIAALKMLVVPLVIVSLIGGVTSLGDLKALGRIGAKAVGLYLVTTAVAISIALALATLIAPGAGAGLGSGEADFSGGASPPLSEVLIGMVPSNPIAAMAEGDMLPIIVFALIFGVAITMAGERGRHVLNFFQDLYEVIMHMVEIVMRLAPIGVFCLIARTFATEGLDTIVELLGYFLTVIAALLVHAAGTYSLLLALAGRLSPVMFFRKMRTVLVFAFSTASSNATIPVTLRTAEQRLGVNNSVASFTVPLGATINMDGTAIMQGVATVFIANVYGIDLGAGEFLAVILTATLASIGTAGVPSVGLIMLAMVLEQVGLPVEGVALIIGVDRLLDMIRTAVNVSGDATVTTLVAKSENAFDEEVYKDPQAGSVEYGQKK